MEKLNVKNLVEKDGEVFVSIYMPTHRTSLDNKQDKVRFNNLLNAAKKELQEKYPNLDAEKYLEKITELKNNSNFWDNGNEGLAILVSDKDTEVHRLKGNTPEKLVVGERFHLLPLLNFYELPNNYYLLDISRDRFQLYQIGMDGLDEIDTPRVYKNFNELFDDRDVSDGDLKNSGGSASTFHGHNAKPEVDERETEKYFRHVSSGLSTFFKARSYPIILFGTTENVSEFKNIANGEIDIVHTIDKPLDSMDERELLETLRTNLLPEYLKEVDEKIEVLNTSIANDKGSDNASRLLKDSETGRIQRLFVNKDYHKESDIDLDKLIYDVIAAGGEIVLVDEEHNKLETGIAAEYRY